MFWEVVSLHKTGVTLHPMFSDLGETKIRTGI
jgi:hypothetical protein